MDTAAPAEWVDVTTLIPWEDNPYDHPPEQVDDIARSITANGWGDVIVAHLPSRRIVSGHGRRLAALRLIEADAGWRLPDAPSPGAVPVRWVRGEWDDVCEALAIAANETARNADRRESKLAEVLERLRARREAGAVVEHGVRDAEVRRLLAARREATVKPEGDDGPPPADTTGAPGSAPDSVLGTVYELGPHRLICGDCRDAAAVDKLMGGALMDVAFTSPPYASQRKYDEESGFKPIPPDDFCDWFDAVQANVREHLARHGSWFVNIKAHCESGQRHLYVHDLLLAHCRRWDWQFVDEFCWVRGGVPGFWTNRLKNAWEPVFHFAVDASSVRLVHENVKHESNDVFDYSPDNPTTHSGFISGSAPGRRPGMALPSNVVRAHSSAAQIADDPEKHSATFPVALPSFFVRAFSNAGDRIYDPFMGSGTTLVAAAKHGRVAYGCEISPKYCDLIRRRWTRWAIANGEDPGPGALHD